MNEDNLEQLDKILALVDSPHDGEAIVAVRKARQLLMRSGLGFTDLVRAAVSRPDLFSFLSEQHDPKETQILHLRQQLEDLRAQMQSQDLQLDFWRRRAMDSEQNISQAQNQAKKWEKLANETMDRLSDVGQSLGNMVFSDPEVIEQPVFVKK